MTAPKLFISYSWSNPEHEKWVLDLATQLRESGVDVTLDKWDLREGHDAVAFMEQMVTNAEVKKVIIVADRTYAAKADGREGGVGTETQIISKEVYEKQTQDKFVVVVAEKDEEGKPFLPTYYKSRIYIDLSEPDKYGEEFERLLRWVFDKPLYEKPELGNKPSFLDEGEHVSLGTTASFKRAVEAIKNNRAYASGALDEYLSIFVKNLERFRLASAGEENFDETVVGNIEKFLPYRNEAIQLFIAISLYSSDNEFIQKIHRFFEDIAPYMFKHPSNFRYSECDLDNFKFIIHELFLYAIAIFIKHERFDKAVYLLEQGYYLQGIPRFNQDILTKYSIFCDHMKSLETRNQRLGLQRASLRADLLKQRCAGEGIDFRNLMQADFVLFMRTEIESQNYSEWWFPVTLVYLERFSGPFEIFARSISKKYFDKIKSLLAINSPSDMEALLISYKERKRDLPRWGFDTINPVAILGYEKLATRP